MLDSLSLLELNKQIQDCLKQSFDVTLWVRAEISEMHENANGHCYLELIEKESGSDRIVAKSKATIWASRYGMLKPYFRAATGMDLQSGMKVLFLVSIEYHELYGLSLMVRDVDPTFTIGEMAMRRAEIIARLREEGVMNMNAELPMPELPHRIAVISSATAAGYGDFCDQLIQNEQGYSFYTKLFPAIMQGSQTESSIIEALDHIFEYIDYFDCVVIIRGGGATADLSSFDSYLLALHVAQFPVPVITGIGHQRDQTILDMVSYVSVKTPTAAAELLISYFQEAESRVDILSQRMAQTVKTYLDNSRYRLQNSIMRLPTQIAVRVSSEWRVMDSFSSKIKYAVESSLNKEKRRIELLERDVIHNNPLLLLNKGYTLTTCNGNIVSSVKELKPGDKLVTYFSDGEAKSVLEEITKKNTKK